MERVESRLKGTCVVPCGQDGVVDRDVESSCFGNGGTDRVVFGPFASHDRWADRVVVGPVTAYDRWLFVEVKANARGACGR